jgi:arylsulfatase
MCTQNVTPAIAGIVAIAAALFASVASASAQQAGKPNVLVIWGDDIRVHNISAYNHGIMGYRTAPHRPNRARGCALQRLLRRAVVHGGRAAFMLGQHPFRTGMLTMGMPDRGTASPTGRRPSPT